MGVGGAHWNNNQCRYKGKMWKNWKTNCLIERSGSKDEGGRIEIGTLRTSPQG